MLVVVAHAIAIDPLRSSIVLGGKPVEVENARASLAGFDSGFSGPEK